MSSTAELLANVPLFRGLESEDLERLANGCRVESFKAGAAIVEIGEPGRSLYIIAEGWVQVLYPSRNSEFELAREQ
jgi:CRP-like cAMP-binding protein